MPLPFEFLDTDALRRRASLAAVAAAVGVRFDDGGYARCPFHDDRSPSLRLWVDDQDVERWNCFPCGISGDVFDLVRRHEGCSFSEAVSFVERVAADSPPAERRRRAEFDAVGCRALVDDASRRAAENPGWLCVYSGLVPAEDPPEDRRVADALLRDELRWGIDHAGNVVMPHYDASGELTGAKVRALDKRKWSFPGSSYPALYGSWRPRATRYAMLTEGETDMGYALLQRPPVDVYALPAGAGRYSPAWAALDADIYFLAFDGDDAGIKATLRWLIELSDRDVRVCRVPRGHDIRSARPDVYELLTSSVRPPSPSNAIVVDNGRFERTGQNGARPLCSWFMRPTSRLEPVDASVAGGFEVVVEANGLETDDVVTMDDLQSEARFRAWTSARMLDNLMSKSDVEQLAALLNAQAAPLPTVFQTQRLGGHAAPPSYRSMGRSVALPGTSLGKLPWRYTGPVEARRHVHLDDDGKVDWSWVSDFLALNEPSVTHPMLAWLAASARRDELTHFPILFLGGSSGSGKTTTARLATQLMGSSLAISLASATEFTLIRALATTTSVPVLVDEWSLQSRQVARDALQSLITALYEGGVAPRGRPDLSVVEIRLSSPTVCAGEDSFNLDREADRMVSLRLRRDAQRPEPLARLAGAPVHRFARWYNEWLLSRHDLPAPPRQAGLANRPEYNRAVLDFGWATLREYMSDAAERGDDVPELPALDLSGLENPDDRENEYVVLLRSVIGTRDRHGLPIAWQTAEGVWIRFSAISSADTLRGVDVELPGRSRAMRAYFEDKFALRESRSAPLPGTLLDSQIPGASSSGVPATLVEGLRL